MYKNTTSTGCAGFCHFCTKVPYYKYVHFQSNVHEKCSFNSYGQFVVASKLIRIVCGSPKKKKKHMYELQKKDHSRAGAGAWGVGRLWGDKALEGQAIVCEQWFAPPMLCLLTTFRRLIYCDSPVKCNSHNTALLWQQEASDQNYISCKSAKCVCHFHWRQWNIKMSYLTYLLAGLVFMHTIWTGRRAH